MPDPAKVLAEFKAEGGPRVIAARVHGVLKSAFSGPPPLQPGQSGPTGFRPTRRTPRAREHGGGGRFRHPGRPVLGTRVRFLWPADGTPFSDNGPFVANLIGTLAGSDALIGLRSRGDTNRPFTLVAAMQSEAEAKFRQTQQALQPHLDEVEKQLRTLRSGGGESDKPTSANRRLSSRPISAPRSTPPGRTCCRHGRSCGRCSWS